MNYARRLDRRAASRAKTLRRSAVKDQFRRGLLAERLEDRALMAGDAFSPFLASFRSIYWNDDVPTDVNADGTVAPNDALAVVNTLNSNGSYELPQEASEGESGRLFIDVNNDGWVSPIDALTVINRLNAEGEPVQPDDKVEYVFTAVAPGTNTPITSVSDGQLFDLVMAARDLRPEGTYPDIDDNGTPSDPTDDFPVEREKVRGVYAAYADVAYEDTLTSVVVFEEQQLGFTGTATGTFKLTVNGLTTAAISYNNVTTGTPTGREQTRANIQAALNTTLGAGEVEVTNPSGNNYRIRFIGSPNVNVDPVTTSEITPTSGTTTINVTTPLSGDPTNAAAFFSAVTFSSVYLNGQSALRATDQFNELGAFFSGATSVGTGTGIVEVLRVRMIATLPVGSTGASQVFTPSFTNIVSPSDDTLVFGNLKAVPPEQSAVALSEIAFNTVTLSIVSGPVNAVPDTASVNEDTAAGVDINVLANDTLNPPATGTIAIKSFTQPTGGTVTQVGNQLRFVPSLDFNGTATFTYTAGINNTPADFATATVTVTVNAVNDAPTIAAISPQTISEDTATTVNLTGIGPGGGTDEANQTLTVTAVTTNPTLIPNITVNYTTGATGTLQFTPAANQSGTATITVTVKDNGGTALNGVDTFTRTFDVTVNAVNDAPENRKGGVAITGAVSVLAPVSPFNFTGADQLSVFDADAGTASITTVLTLSGTSPGTLTVGSQTGTTITLTGSQTSINTQLQGLTYTAGTDFTAALTMATTDNATPGLTTTSTINISRDPGVRPFAVPDAAVTAEADAPAQVIIPVLTNDFTEPGRTNVVTITTPPSQGSATVNASNQIVYTTPGGNFFTPPGQPVTLVYTLSDGVGTPTTATVAITVTNTNDAPVGVADTFDAQAGVATTIAPRGVLINDTDVDGDILTAVNASTPTGGTVNLNANGSFVYTSAATGTFTFTYQARDPGGLTSAATTVTMRVSGPATATNDTATATEDGGAQTFPSVLANDDDGDPTQVIPLTATLVSNVPTSAGSVTLNADGTFTYNPAANFNTTRPPTSPITFTYRANAGAKESNIATVSITVTETNDNPTAGNDTFLAVKRSGSGATEIGVDQPVTVLTNDSFAPDTGETLTVTAVNGGTGPSATPKGGSVRLVGGQILYTSPTTVTPAGDPDTFTYTISDGRNGTATATVSVTVVDFVPKIISGKVFIDNGNGLAGTANNGLLDSGEKGLAGVDVQLTGTSFDSATAGNVNLTVTTDIDGNYSFVGLKPPKDGTFYTVLQLQPLYLLNGLDTNSTGNAQVTNSNSLDNRFTLTYGVTDASGNISGLNFAERGVDVNSLDDASGFIHEFLASSSGNGFVMATDLAGDVLFSWSLVGWENAKSIKATLSSDLSICTLSGFDKRNNAFSVNLTQDTTAAARFRILGIGQNGQYIIRIDGTSADAGLNLLAAVPAGSGGEGESAAQYAAGADALFAGQAWA